MRVQDASAGISIRQSPVLRQAARAILFETGGAMDALAVLFLLFLLLFFLALFGALAFLIFKYLSVKEMLEKLRQEQTGWQSREREIAQKEATAQLQQWRQQELESAQRQQLEVARREALVQLEQWKTEYEQSIRQDAIQRSQSVTIGKVTEHIIPYLPDFKYNPKDARFIGSPIDFVIFDGLDDGEIRDVVFVEIKTGASSLSGREKQIRDAVQAGKIEWVELRPNLKLERSTGEVTRKT